MKTTIDIPESELQEVIRQTGANTKRQAILTAVREFNRRARLQETAKLLGSFENFMIADDLKDMREDPPNATRGRKS